MPTLDTIIGGSASNSYVTLEEAGAYLDEQLNAGIWAETDEDNRKRALIVAARRLDREIWQGNRTSSTQKLAWPRIDVPKLDQSGWGDSHHAGSLNDLDIYPSDQIPDLVKQAQIELALAYLNGFDDGESDPIKKWSDDKTSVEYSETRIPGGLPVKVARLLDGLVLGNQLQRG